MGYKEMALDAGYKGDEADAVAADLELANRLEEERYWHDRAVEEVEMLEVLEQEREEIRKKFINLELALKAQIQPLKMNEDDDFIEITHNGRTLIRTRRFDFNKAKIDDLVEVINRSNR